MAFCSNAPSVTGGGSSCCCSSDTLSIDNITDSTTLPQLFEIILHRLELHHEPYIQSQVDECCLKFIRNWILNVGLLRRVSSCKIKRLQLPLLLEEEILNIINTTSNPLPLPLVHPHKNYSILDNINNNINNNYNNNNINNNNNDKNIYINYNHNQSNNEDNNGLNNNNENNNNNHGTSTTTSSTCSSSIPIQPRALQTSDNVNKMEPTVPITSLGTLKDTPQPPLPPSTTATTRDSLEEDSFLCRNRGKSFISKKQKELIKQSWSELIESGKEQAFHRVFSRTFFSHRPVSKRLFPEEREDQGEGMVTVGEETGSPRMVVMVEEPDTLLSPRGTFTSMMRFILKNLDNPNLESELSKLGGRHEIYGVSQDDYTLFVTSVGVTLEKLLGAEIFTKQTSDAWKSALLWITQQMQQSGKSSLEIGIRRKVYREICSHEGAKWSEAWALLTLSTLKLFHDPAYRDFLFQYPLSSVDKIKRLPDQLHCFELHFFNFESVKIRAINEQEFDEWFVDLDWRIKAYQRSGNFSSESDSENSNDEDKKIKDKDSPMVKRTLTNTTTTTTTNPCKATPKLAQRKRERLQKQHADSKIDRTLHFSQRQKELVKNSWKLLNEKEVKHECGVKQIGVTTFYGEFYNRFFKVNPSGKRLFEECGMRAQTVALVQMLTTIVKCLDNEEIITQIISELGGRHEIYGVKAGDYTFFANATCDTFGFVLGDSFTIEMREAWFHLMMEVSSLMQDSGRRLKFSGPFGVVYRKFRPEGKWKKSMISLTLETLFIYHGEKMGGKFRCSVPLQEVVETSTFITTDSINMPTEFGFELTTSNIRRPNIYICTDNQGDFKRFFKEISWRVKAIHRIYKEETSNEEEINNNNRNTYSNSSNNNNNNNNSSSSSITNSLTISSSGSNATYINNNDNDNYNDDYNEDDDNDITTKSPSFTV